MSSSSESRAVSSLVYPLIGWASVGFVGAAFLTYWVFDHRFRDLLDAQLDRELQTMVIEIKGVSKRPLDESLFQSEIDHHSIAKGQNNVFYKLFLQSQSRALQSNLDAWQELELPQPQASNEGTRIFFHKTSKAHPGARILEKALPGGDVLQIGLSLSQLQGFQNRARWMMAGALFLVAALGATLVALIIKRRLKNFASVFRDASNAIQFGDFHTAIARPTGDRASDWLAQTFNGVFSNIHELMNEMDQVLGDVAHDLRTPVARLRSHAETIISEPNPTQRELELAGRTIEECDHILTLVNTILEINAAEARTTSLRNEDVDFTDLVYQAVDLFGSMIEDKRHTVTCELPQRCILFGDRRYLQRILANLLDNAVKYTPEGGTIQISLSHRKHTLTLQVMDNGIGIAEAEAALIFNRFYRSDKSRTMPGNGLGLTFCKAIAEAMGGELVFRPNPTGGSIFELILPDGIKERQFRSKSQQ